MRISVVTLCMALIVGCSGEIKYKSNPTSPPVGASEFAEFSIHFHRFEKRFEGTEAQIQQLQALVGDLQERNNKLEDETKWLHSWVVDLMKKTDGGTPISKDTMRQLHDVLNRQDKLLKETAELAQKAISEVYRLKGKAPPEWPKLPD